MELNPHYKAFCSTLCDIMDKEWGKQEGKFAASWPFLNHVPSIAWKPMVTVAADKWDGWPKNWAKCVKEVYELWRSSAKHSSVKFNPEYDDRYPVEKMHVAYDVLSDSGEQAFKKYCDDTGMPLSDRDRVVMKYRVIRGEVRIDTNEIKRKIGAMGQVKLITCTPDRMVQLQSQKRELLKDSTQYTDEVPF